MKTKTFLFALIRAAVFAGFYFWSEGSAGAGRLVQFALCALAVMMILAALHQVDKPVKLKRNPWKTGLQVVSDLVTVVLLVWLDCQTLAAIWLVAAVLKYAAEGATEVKPS